MCIISVRVFILWTLYANVSDVKYRLVPCSMQTRSKSKNTEIMSKLSNTELHSSDEDTNEPILSIDLTDILNQISLLQKTVENLSLAVASNNAQSQNNDLNIIPMTDHRSYISHWKELGGSNLFFFPDGKLHPMLFMKKLKNIFEEAGVPDRHRVGLAVACLKGAAADWVAIKESSFKTFKDFENGFSNKFWGVDRQRDLFLHLNYGRYERGSCSSYFLDMVNQAGFLSEKIPEYKLINMLGKHFSSDIERAIVMQGLNTVEAVDIFLQKMDDTFSSGNSKSRDNRGQRGQGGNFNSGGNNPDNRRPNNQGNERYSRVEGNREDANNVDQSRVTHITMFNEDIDFFSSDSDEEVIDSTNLAPFVDIEIEENTYKVLIDSGSDITAISEDFYKEISKEKQLPIIPVTAMSFSVAVGTKKHRVKRQVLLTAKIKGCEFDINSFVIPGLNQNIIFGSDWLTKFGVQLNFVNSTLNFNYRDHILTVNFQQINSTRLSTVNVCLKKEFSRNNSTDSKHHYSENDFEAAVAIGETGSEAQRETLLTLLKKYEMLFSETPGSVKSYVHNIEMNDEMPFSKSSYPIPFIYRQQVRDQIHEMLLWDIIEKRQTEYVSPLVTVKKKDGTVRICLDARALNIKMKPDFVNPPNMDELYYNFRKGMIFSTIDLTASYWQIKINPLHRKYIGFIYEGESYVFNRLPFGLKTSMASLIRCLNTVLGETCRDFVVIYVDDLLVYSPNVESHLINLQQIFEKFKSEGITLKLRKCQFLKYCVTFIGHIISSDGVQLDPKRIEAIENFPAPRNVRELRSFLGLINYERRFCDRFANAVVPLLRLLRKREKWSWGELERNAFLDVKKKFLDATLMVHPEFEKRFFINCDSSDHAIGGCLFQELDTGVRGVIAYTSCTLKGSQLRYTTTEKEMFALVHCLKQWRTLVLGRQLTIITDHKSLNFIFTSNFKSARLSRWIMAIQEFHFDIQHIPGVSNTIADTLSRFPVSNNREVGPFACEYFNISAIKWTNYFEIVKQNLPRLQADQLGEEWIQARIQFLENSKMEVKVWTVKEYQIYRWFLVHDGLLFKKGDSLNPGFKLCVPGAQIQNIVLAEHIDGGHFGKAKVYAHLREKFYWPKMQRHIRQLVASCDLCQKSKCSPRSRGLLHSITPKQPGNLICVDLIGPLPSSRGGVTQLLVIVDAFSKYVRLYALKRATTKAILNKILTDYFISVQKPKVILSDNGTQFTARDWGRILSTEGVECKFISVYFPEGNPTERYNKEVGRMLRAYCYEKHTRWAHVLSFIEDCLNNSINGSTGYRPSYLQFGITKRHPIEKYVSIPEDTKSPVALKEVWLIVNDRLTSRARHRAEKHNARIKPTTINIGDKVLVKSHALSSAESHTIKKFFLLYEGPFVVSAIAGPNSYLITDSEGSNLPKQNIKNLKLYKEPSALL